MNPAGLTVSVTYIGVTLLTAALLARAARRPAVVLAVVGAWMLVQGAIAWSGFYTVTDTVPPRLLLALAPPLGTIAVLFLLPAGRRWLDALDLRTLTWLHVVRVPVEWGLHQLYVEGLVPQVMTYEGRNFDILSGLSAAVVAWIAFDQGRVRRSLLLGWNAVCLVLLGVIVFHGVLSVPTPFQRFGFEQPNTGLLYFPFVWLPAVIVPAVLLAHLAAFRRLLRTTG